MLRIADLGPRIILTSTSLTIDDLIFPIVLRKIWLYSEILDLLPKAESISSRDLSSSLGYRLHFGHSAALNKAELLIRFGYPRKTTRSQSIHH